MLTRARQSMGARNRPPTDDEKALAEARTDCASFIEYAIPHEETGRPVINAPFHREWHEHFDKHQFAILIASVEHAKTQQIGVGRPLHMLGNDVNKRIAIISNTGPMATKTLASIRTHIEHNEQVQKVFPHLRPSPLQEHPWHNKAITVERTSIAKDPSIQALGAYGDIVGSRLDGILIDDLLDFENSRTIEQRKKLIEWFETSVFTRLTANGVLWIIGTPWHQEDFLHILETRPDFHAKRYPAVINPDDPEEHWKPIWPEAWPLERLLKRKRNMHPAEFARKYLCEVRSDENSRFRKDWLDGALRLGTGFNLVSERPRLVNGQFMECYTGVDLGVGQNEEHDLSAIVTIGRDERGRKRLVNMQSGRWQGPEIIQRLWSTLRRFNSIIRVESNAQQMFIVQFAHNEAIPCEAFNTGKNKWSPDFGIESIAVQMQSALWVFPSGADGGDPHPEVTALVRDALYFTPTEHTPDRLMALWFASTCFDDHTAPRVQDVDMQSR